MQENKRVRKEKRIWEKMAGFYDKQIGKYEDAYDQSIKRTKNLVEDYHNVLEIGCGTGIITFGVADYVDRITAVDVSPKMIKVAEEKANNYNCDNIIFDVQDGCNLPYQDESFDIVLMFNLLHFLKEPALQIRESYRVLKRGGFLITATDCYGDHTSLKVKIWLKLQTILNKVGIIPYLSNFERSDLERLMIENGYQIVDTAILYEDPINYYLSLKK